MEVKAYREEIPPPIVKVDISMSPEEFLNLRDIVAIVEGGHLTLSQQRVRSAILRFYEENF